jgi:hypothetical protein
VETRIGGVAADAYQASCELGMPLLSRFLGKNLNLYAY